MSHQGITLLKHFVIYYFKPYENVYLFKEHLTVNRKRLSHVL